MSGRLPVWATRPIQLENVLAVFDAEADYTRFGRHAEPTGRVTSAKKAERRPLLSIRDRQSGSWPGGGTAGILRASMSPRKKPGNRPPLVLRVVKARPRLFSSAALGILIVGALSLSNRWPGSTRVLVGWDTAVAVYLVLAFFMMARSNIQIIKSRAAEEDEGQLAILMLTVISAVASLGAIVVELSSSALPGGGRRGSHILLASLTIMLSWFFIQIMFALHYAHEFYAAADGRGLAFPGDEHSPDYWDFLYFSLVIGMTSQVSDVGVVKKEIRRTVAAHGVISFFFNVALLALTVNIAASAI